MLRQRPTTENTPSERGQLFHVDAHRDWGDNGIRSWVHKGNLATHAIGESAPLPALGVFGCRGSSH
jgi:hypothetical protein